MKYILVLLIIVALPSNSWADPPLLGGLCNNALEPLEANFWRNWNEADWVVFGVAISGITPIDVVVPDQPDLVIGSFPFFVYEVWKGPESLEVIDVSTSWTNYLWHCNPPEIPGCTYLPEACALEVQSGRLAVLFLRFSGDELWTYNAYGTGDYDLAWLQNYVGSPVSNEQTTWGAVKSFYR
jgi:hypothetical protein